MGSHLFAGRRATLGEYPFVIRDGRFGDDDRVELGRSIVVNGTPQVAEANP